MKVITILIAQTVSFCNFLIAQQKDSVNLSPMQSFYEVRLNSKDTAFRNTKFLLPPTGFIPDNKVPFKTKAEVDSITKRINALQQKIILRSRQIQYQIKTDSLKNGNPK